MTRSFGLVDYKVQEAEYFLLELRHLGKQIDFAAVQFCASAFVSAARSITFAMQSSLKGYPKFETWYETCRQALRTDSLARFFHDFRTVTQHIGVNVVGGGSYINGEVLYYFVACPDLPTVPEQNIIAACESYFTAILEMVYDCYIEFGSMVDGQQYFTKENFAVLEKTIEDAEEELGFPRGWTNIGRSDLEPYRWQMLRQQADGCLIEEQFKHWLNKALPRPEPLPPFES